MRLFVFMVLSLPLCAQFGNVEQKEFSFVLSRFTNHDYPAILRPHLPLLPADFNLDGIMVSVSPVDPRMKADAFSVTIRYKGNGKVMSRTQIIPRRLDGPSSDLFRVGIAEPISISAKAISWESSEETNTSSQ